MSTAQKPILDDEITHFLQGPVTLTVAARDDDLAAAACYAHGCRVEPDGRIVVFLSGERAADILANLQRYPVVAFVACRPTTLRTYQFKAPDARIVPLAPGDRERVRAYVEMVIAELALIGDPIDWSRAAFDFDPDQLVAIAFTPTQLYVQTPGPQAGAPIGVSAP